MPTSPSSRLLRTCALATCLSALLGSVGARAQEPPAQPAPSLAPATQPVPTVAQSEAQPSPVPEAASSAAPPAPLPTAPAAQPPEAPVCPAAALAPALSRELLEIDERLGQIKAQRRGFGLAGPLTLMVSGYAGAGLFGFIALLQHSSVKDIEEVIALGGEYNELDDVNDDGVVDRRDLRQAKRAQWALVGVAGAHLSLGILGTWWRMRRASARHALDAEAEGLSLRRQSAEMQLRMALTPGGAAGSVALPF